MRKPARRTLLGRPIPTVVWGMVAIVLLVSPGCWVPKSRVSTLETQNRSLTDKVAALEFENSKLESYSQRREDQLIETERALVAMEAQSGLDRRQLANLESERDFLHRQAGSGIDHGWNVSPEVRRRLEALSEQFGGLQFDPVLGVSKLNTDILFDEGEETLKPGADVVLANLVRALHSAEGQQLRVLVVGHTDDRQLAGRPVRDQFGDNFQLSTARANVVGQRLRALGLESERLGVAGFGPHQPVASNKSEEDRKRNRRVELFVMAPNVPVIGWTETVSHLY